MKKVLFLLIVIASITVQSYAQKQGKSKTDSLLSVLKTAKPDTAKVNTLNSLAYEVTNNNPDTAIYFTSQAQALAIKLNYKTGIANSYLNIGRALTHLGNCEKALKNCNDAITIYDQLLPAATGTEKTGEKSKLLKQKANAYNNIGAIYQILGNNPEAMKNYFAGLEIYEETGNKSGIARIYSNIGIINNSQGHYAEAMKNFFNALKIYEEIGDKLSIGINYRNIGVIYTNQGDYPEALKNLSISLKFFEETGDNRNVAYSNNSIGVIYLNQGNYPEALKNFYASLKIMEKIDNKRGIAQSYMNIGLIYYYQGNYHEAMKNYFAALKINEEIGDKQSICETYSDIGLVYSKQKKYNEASQYFNKGLSLAKEIGSLKDISECYEVLAALDSAQGRFKQALEQYKMHIIYRDSLINKENTKKIVQSQMQYDFDKKEAVAKAEQEKRDVIAHKELQKQKLVRDGFIGGFAVVLLFAVVFFMQRTRIKKGKKRSEELLLNILPYEVAEELKQTGHCQAKTFSMVTVMFMDFKDFTSVSEKVSAELLVGEINFCFSAFDQIVQKYKVEKIKTVGDAYICVSGLPVLNYTHAIDVVNAAIEIRNFMLSHKKEKELRGEIPFELRIGIHTGPVVAGIVGLKKFQYDIWGDTVNLSARMESSGEAGQINISGTTHALVKDKFHCTHRGKIQAKNKGEVDMYFVDNESYKS